MAHREPSGSVQSTVARPIARPRCRTSDHGKSEAPGARYWPRQASEAAGRKPRATADRVPGLRLSVPSWAQIRHVPGHGFSPRGRVQEFSTISTGQCQRFCSVFVPARHKVFPGRRPDGDFPCTLAFQPPPALSRPASRRGSPVPVSRMNRPARSSPRQRLTGPSSPPSVPASPALPANGCEECILMATIAQSSTS